MGLDIPKPAGSRLWHRSAEALVAGLGVGFYSLSLTVQAHCGSWEMSSCPNSTRSLMWGRSAWVLRLQLEIPFRMGRLQHLVHLAFWIRLLEWTPSYLGPHVHLTPGIAD